MANVGAMIANRGWFYTPHFVKSIGNNGPLPQFKKKHFTMVDAKHFEAVIEGMRRVVYVDGGTGRQARSADYIVCGKTGTVENKPKKDHAVFLAFAPMDKPKIAIVVFIENAGFGGTWSAPIASLMMDKYIKGHITDTVKERKMLDFNVYGTKKP